MTEEFLREVDEDLKRERYERLWKKYGRFVISGAVGLVVLAAGWEGWKQYDLRQRQELADRYIAALEAASEDNRAGAVTALARLAAETKTGFGALARLQQAALLAEGGNRNAALDVYDALVADTTASPALRDLATVQGALAAVETEPVASIERRVARVNTGTSPWRFVAREALAFARLRAGQTAEARALLRGVADDVAAPSGARARAAELLAALGA